MSSLASENNTTMTTENNKKKKLTLRSSDREIFEVDEAVALVSQTLKYMVEDDCADTVIPLPVVSSSTLSKVIEYCKMHANSASDNGESKNSKAESSTESTAAAADENLKAWDANFVKVRQHILYDLMQAANYLNIKSLLELTCKQVANMMKGKTPNQIRKIFKITNDFTPEEEAEIQREFKWKVVKDADGKPAGSQDIQNR